MKWAEELNPNDEKGEIILSDLQGRIVKKYDSIEGENRFFIDSSDLENGIYVMKLKLNNHEKTIKISVFH